MEEDMTIPELLIRARALDAHEKHEDAIICYDLVTSRLRNSILGIQPPHSSPPSSHAAPPSKEQAVEALVGKGVALGRLGRGTAAAAALEEALELDPVSTTGLCYLALLRIKEEKLAEGISLYRRCLAVDTKCQIAVEGLATILTDEGTRLKQAGQVMSKPHSIHNDSPELQGFHTVRPSARML